MKQKDNLVPEDFYSIFYAIVTKIYEKPKVSIQIIKNAKILNANN